MKVLVVYAALTAAGITGLAAANQKTGDIPETHQASQIQSEAQVKPCDFLQRQPGDPRTLAIRHGFCNRGNRS